MPQNPDVRRRHIQVDADFLPNPATKLVITECFESDPETNCWAWLIVAVFYDHRGRSIWSTEVFYAQLDVESDTDENITQANWSGDEQGQAYYSDSHSLQQVAPSHHFLAYNFCQTPFPTYTSIQPPISWDPSRQGAVPGHWQASFEPTLRRWVHTWQPDY